MARSRRKTPKGAVEAGYASSDDTPCKETRRIARRKFRRDVKASTTAFVKTNDLSYDLDVISKEKPSEEDGRACLACLAMCKRPVHDIHYNLNYIGNREKLQLERFEMTKELAVLRRYRKIMFK